MGRIARSGLTLLGLVAALGWSVLFVRAPGLAMEQLVLWSPVVVAGWLIVMLSGRTRTGAAKRKSSATSATSLPAGIREAVLARDGGACSLCGAAGAGAVAARRPARRGDADPLDRYFAFCDDCVAAGALIPHPTTPGGAGSRTA